MPSLPCLPHARVYRYVFIRHQVKNAYPGDASRPHSDNAPTARRATRSRPEAFLLVRVPVYGLCDSGRGFWKKVDGDAKEVGLLSSRIFPAFIPEREGRCATHADDFLWACTESGHAVVDRLLTRFEVGRKEEGRLRICGKQFDASGRRILLDVEDITPGRPLKWKSPSAGILQILLRKVKRSS